MVKKKPQRKRTPVSKKFIPQASIVSDEIYLPNHSGEHTAGTTGTPINERDIVNKEYVDSIATKSAIELFLTENGSGVGGYFDLEIDVVTAAKENIVQSITAGGTTLIASFVTKLGEEEINAIKLLESGIYNHHAHADAATSKNLFIYYEFYHRTAGGTETLLGTSHDSNELTTSEAGYDLHTSITDEKAFVSGDRIVIKVYGRNKSAAARNVTIYMEGDTASRVEFPAFISSTFVPAHTIVSHSDTTGTGAELDTLTDNSMADTLHRHSELSASDGSPDAVVSVDSDGILYADASPVGIDILYSATIGAHLSVGNNITVGGTVDGIDIATDVAANTLKVTNVTTNLSAGTRAPTTIDVNSSDGTNATLVEADTTNAGILGSDKWDEIVAATSHVADVTGDPHNIAADTLTFTNKTIDQDGVGNSITNLADASIKAGAAIARTKLANVDVVDDTTPELGGELDAGAHTIGFTQQTATGDGTTTIDWKLGNKFYFTFGAQNDTFTFTAPSNPCNLILVLKQDGTGSRIPTFPAAVHWSGGSMPTFSTGAAAVDIVAFYYDGTNYFGVETLDFS